jgi:tRNA(Arg) A34 adenosine deaminase TadA
MTDEPTPEQMARHLRRTNAVARRAMELGRHPFGALLVGPDHERVLGEQGNIGTVEHAESTLARAAAKDHAPAFLWTCTLYTNFEPCAMCSGTIYWANIGCVVFGVSEARLLEMTGNHPENPTLSVSARYVFDHGQKPIRLYGPMADVETETLALHKEFWKR